MKWNMITHNIRGLNDPESISKERCFLTNLTPKVDVVMIQEHKLRGKSLENLGNRLMPGCSSWILEAAPGERSWLNPNAAGKGGVGILLANKYAKLVKEHGALYDDRVVWIKLEGIEGGSIGIACIYAPNIPTDRRHLWHIMVDALPKDCEWIIGGDFNMTERPQDKSNDCGRGISDLERFTWGELLNALQVQDTFIHQGGPRFSWNNGQKGKARRLARLDRFYIPEKSKLEIHHKSYFIHGYPVGSDHAPVQIELHIGNHEVRKSAYKWNIAHLKGDMMAKLREIWERMPADATFFAKLRHVTRFYRQFSKQKASENKREELYARANLETTTARLHEDIHNEDKQGEVNRYKGIIEGIEDRKARGATIRARVKWQKVGDKCTGEFFKSVRQKNTLAIISELRDTHGRSFTRKEDLEAICLDFYKNLYKHKDISEGAINEVLEGLPATFTCDINEALAKDITERELATAVASMSNGKAPGQDGVPIEFFKKMWSTIGADFLHMLVKGYEDGFLHEGVTRGLISLIPKEGDLKDLNYWRPITLLNNSYKIFAKTLQRRLQPILRDVISPEQTAFLPLRFILDNIVLTQEALHWARTSKQPMVFLKLDFSKAYDKVSWHFLFRTMRKMNVSAKFIKWVEMFFTNASAAVNLNGSPGNSFKIERGVRQGCPLAPYLFLIVGEALTHTIKKAVTEGRLRRITLPGGHKQQSISQYADDSSFMVRGEKKYVDELVRLLKVFSAASGMEIN